MGGKLWESKWMGKLMIDEGEYQQALLCGFLWYHLWADMGLELSPMIDFCPSYNEEGRYLYKVMSRFLGQ